MSEPLFPPDAWDDLPEENIIRVSNEAYDMLLEELDRPPTSHPRLAALMREPNRFERADDDTLPQYGPGEGNTDFNHNEETDMPR